MRKFITFLIALAACAAILPVAAAVDITVNGVNVSAGSGPGWTSSSTGLSLTSAGPFTISGNNNGGQFNINPLADCTIIASNLTVDNSGTNGSALYIGANPYQVTLLLAGTNTFAGGSKFAGICIESGTGSLVISNWTDLYFITNWTVSATLVARGGNDAAGIGGGSLGTGGKVTIAGGDVTATGSAGGAGIGGGAYCPGGAVTITGGRVAATGGVYGAGIGGGYAGAGGTVTVSGGTVTATRGSQYYHDIGGFTGAAPGANTFTGGSILLANGSISNAPVNAAAANVHCVTFVNATSAAAVADIKAGLAALSPGYGVDGIQAVDGKVYAWLPDGTYNFVFGGQPWRAVVAGAATTAECLTTGVTVNGVDAYFAGPGWTYSDAGIALTNAGPFVISGNNNKKQFNISPNTDCTIVASNLVVDDSGTTGSALYIGGNPYHVRLLLAGTNTFVGGTNFAGVCIENGAGSLTISNWTASATLVARGGYDGAGIGGGYRCVGGKVTIAGGDVTATGSSGGAGIGGGAYCSGGAVTIAGGTVTANGAVRSAGIGGGYKGRGGTVTVSGGTVTATRGSTAYQDIGGWTSAAASAVTITGGSVHLANGSVALAPSNGAARVSCVTFANATSAAALADIKAGLAALSPGYGVDGIQAVDGKVYAWLPDGDYAFTIGGNVWRASVNGAGATIGPAFGVTVNGADVNSGPGTGWTFSGTGLSLTNAGPFTISGNNNKKQFNINPLADCTIIASNLTVDNSGANGSALYIGVNPYQVTLLLAGANTFAAGGTFAGICIESGAGSLTISNRETSATLSVRGGSSAAGIGGGLSGAGGTVTVSGGIITTIGGYGGAGIGGGLSGAGGTVTVSGGIITTISGHGGAGIGGGDVGLGGGNAGLGGTMTISGGTVTANGGDYGAGIGGGNGGAGGTVTISGGTVTANGGDYGAGIGGGDQGRGGTVTISGGIVAVNGNAEGEGAGIGGGSGGAGGTATISGGTVFASASAGWAGQSIGHGHNSSSSGANTFTGGSIYLSNGSISEAPSNGTARVWCVTVTGLVANAAVTLRGLEMSEPLRRERIVADADGKVYLWLPDGAYRFALGGRPWRVTVAGEPATAERAPIGLTVNGLDVGCGAGPGWTRSTDGTIVSLTNAGPFVVSGNNGGNAVAIRTETDCAVVVSNLVLDLSDLGMTPFDCGGKAVALALWSDAGMTNVFMGGDECAGMRTTGGSLAITALNGTAALLAVGGSWSAGIGGDSDHAGGTVTISGGAVTAQGTYNGAGIGGGYAGAGGVITISGGDVTCSSRYSGAGIGGGTQGAGGVITISGGRVTATGGYDGGAAIGGGGYAGGNGGTVTISGGTVVAGGSTGGADIGGGKYGTGGTVTITGGSVHLLNGTVALAPSNGTERVWCVTTGGFVANARLAVVGLPATYGVNDLYADASGNAYLWLPAGGYIEGGVSTDGATTNAVLQGFGVSATGVVTGPTNVTLTITGFTPEAGVTNWTPKALPPAHVETIYADSLTNNAPWGLVPPAASPAVFMKLRVK